MTVENRYSFLPEAFLQKEGASEIQKLSLAIQKVFDRVDQDLEKLGDQRTAIKKDGDTILAQCELSALIALSWELQTERLPGEDTSSWRDRVANAILERVNAGSPAGFKKMLEIFGVSNPVLIERPTAEDWDQIKLKLNPTVSTFSSDVFNHIFHKWGRTCRRHLTSYEYESDGAVVRPGVITCATTVFPVAE